MLYNNRLLTSWFISSGFLFVSLYEDYFILYLFIRLCRVLVETRWIFSCGMLTPNCCMWGIVPWPGVKARPPTVGACGVLAIRPAGKSLLVLLIIGRPLVLGWHTNPNDKIDFSSGGKNLPLSSHKAQEHGVQGDGATSIRTCVMREHSLWSWVMDAKESAIVMSPGEF